jgi:multidrug efflux pump subunit AcrB
VFSRFFIDRPIFASVLSIVITLTGFVAIPTLPVAQYPQITPPSIIVQCNYPGASAQVVAESVAAPIEQQVNGVEDMIYMSSQSGNDGSYSLSVTFKPGVNLNFAQVLVQNRVNLALPLLPDVVKQAGVTTRKRNPDILLIVSLYSPNHTYDQFYLSNYATIYCKDEVARVEGVGDVFLFGQQDYCMRIWVDPDRMGTLNLTAGDVVGALREQNQQVAAGHIGQPPAPASQLIDWPISTLGRLSDPEQFANIVLRTSPDGRMVRIKDVGKVATEPRNQDVTSKIDGDPCTSLAVFQLPYANAIDTADNVRAKMDELKKDFPDDVDYKIAYDTTPVISESITEVFRTLGLAVLLVAVVVLVFLQNWRSTVIPLTAVPVAIIGTFGAMAAIGFSINNLTLFGMVLAIGIVVDDAIVVVEAVEHHIEEGLRPREAAYRAMEQVSGPVMAVALVLSAVFIPCAFISGITGQFFRQFALTIAVSTIISAFNSLTLSPALAAILLRPRKRGTYEPLPRLAFLLVGGGLGYWAAVRWLAPELPQGALPVVGSVTYQQAAPWTAAVSLGLAACILAGPLNVALAGFFRLFELTFRRLTGAYTRLVGVALRGSAVVLVIYGGLMLLTWWNYNRLPTGYIPNQDSRRLFAAVQLPDSASLERTQEVVDLVCRIAQGDGDFGGNYRSPPPMPPALYTLTREALESLESAGAPQELLAELEPYVEVDWARSDIESLIDEGVAQEEDRKRFRNLLGNDGKLTAHAVETLRAAHAPDEFVEELRPVIGSALEKSRLDDLLRATVGDEDRTRLRMLLAKFGVIKPKTKRALIAAGASKSLMTKVEPYFEKDVSRGVIEFLLESHVKSDTVRATLLDILADYGKRYLRMAGVDHTIGVAGQSFTLSANGSNFGNLFITLEDFGTPGGSKRSSDDILADLQRTLDEEIPKHGMSAIVKLLGPPPVSGLGSSGGFKFIIEDRSGDNDLVKLQNETERFIAASRPRPAQSPDSIASAKSQAKPDDVELASDKQAPSDAALEIAVSKQGPATSEVEVAAAIPVPEDPGEDAPQAREGPKGTKESKGEPKVAGLFTVFRANSPQLYVDLNRKQCQTMGVNPNDVFTTLQVYLGSFYVNDFNKFGRTWQVVVQAEGQFRNNTEEVRRQKVRNASGNMVPLGAVLDIREIEGPLLLMRYNMYPAAAVVGSTAPGVSSGEGIDAMERLANKTLPRQSMGYEWTEINFIQVDAAKNIWNNLIFPLAVVFVFLVLAAQYESWALPLAVILVVPMCMLGSLSGVAATRSQDFTDFFARIGVSIAPTDINIFTQIGFVVLVGLASKNAILIVEFAKHKVEEGLSRREATLAACQLRLRPILMTSFAFILGVVPLILASGAGHEMRQTLGTAVFSGMLGVTLFGIFLTPVFFFVVDWFVEKSVFAPERIQTYKRVLHFLVVCASLGLIWLIPIVWKRLPRRSQRSPATTRRPTTVPDGDGAKLRDGQRRAETIQAEPQTPRAPRK